MCDDHSAMDVSVTRVKLKHLNVDCLPLLLHFRKCLINPSSVGTFCLKIRKRLDDRRVKMLYVLSFLLKNPINHIFYH